MLRTSLRKDIARAVDRIDRFLSSNAQDFIEEHSPIRVPADNLLFLSSNAQDFIEEFRR